MRRGGASPVARARGRRWGTGRAGRWCRCAGALAVAPARQPWGGQPRADFADGRNRLNREVRASTSVSGSELRSQGGEVGLAGVGGDASAGSVGELKLVIEDGWTPASAYSAADFLGVA